MRAASEATAAPSCPDSMRVCREADKPLSSATTEADTITCVNDSSALVSASSSPMPSGGGGGLEGGGGGGVSSAATTLMVTVVSVSASSPRRRATADTISTTRMREAGILSIPASKSTKFV